MTNSRLRFKMQSSNRSVNARCDCGKYISIKANNIDWENAQNHKLLLRNSIKCKGCREIYHEIVNYMPAELYPPTTKIKKDTITGTATKPENNEHLNEPNIELKCPKCGSVQFDSSNKGFSIPKAIIGGLVWGGPLGGAAGLIGRKNTIITCLNCGNRWQAGKMKK